MIVYLFIILAHFCLNYKLAFSRSYCLEDQKGSLVFAFFFFFVGTLMRINESLLFDPGMYQRMLYIFFNISTTMYLFM